MVAIKQRETVAEAIESFKKAVALVLDDRLEGIKRGLPVDAIEEAIAI